MRKEFYLILTFISVLIVSCEKGKEDKHFTNSTFAATLNDTNWVSTSSWYDYDSDKDIFVVVGTKRDEQFYQDGQLRFDFKAKDISKSNTVTSFYSEWNYIVGGDAISETYYIDSSYNNLIEISLLDKKNKQIAGTFTIKLIKDSTKVDTLLFEKGKFNISY